MKMSIPHLLHRIFGVAEKDQRQMSEDGYLLPSRERLAERRANFDAREWDDSAAAEKKHVETTAQV
jgi:hypothetical protein